jgi:hypothetical protein
MKIGGHFEDECAWQYIEREIHINYMIWALKFDRREGGGIKRGTIMRAIYIYIQWNLCDPTPEFSDIL